MLLLRQEFPDKAKRKVIAVEFNPFFLNNLTLQKRLEYRYSMLLSKKKGRRPSVSASVICIKMVGRKKILKQIRNLMRNNKRCRGQESD